MSCRYTLSIYENHQEKESIQLFRNRIIPEIHDFIASTFSIPFDDDGEAYFEVELDSDTLNALYRIIDHYCYDYAQLDETHAHIDLLDYDQEYTYYRNFGEANLAVAANDLVVLQSAALNLLLCQSKYILGYTYPYQIGEGVRVVFRFS